MLMTSVISSQEDGNRKEIKMRISNDTYDFLRAIADLILPALGALYFALAGIWGFPYGEQIVGTITAIVAFLDIVLKVLKRNYDKEALNEPDNI